MAPWQDAVAVQDFGPAYDRYGSISTLLADATRPFISAMPPIATALVPGNEWSRNANRRHCDFRDFRKGISLLVPVPVRSHAAEGLE
jgi:hypothetical protein